MDNIDILAIDDDPVVHKIIRKALEAEGYRVRTESDGEAGLKAAIERPPHVVLLDVEMPRMDGYQVCQELHARPEFRFIPIVFLSAHSSLEERMVGYQKGADDYMLKPFQAEELRARLAVLLRYADQQRDLNEQIEDAKKTAMQALHTSGELGLALSFMEGSFHYHTIDQAAAGLLQVTSDLGLECRMLMQLNARSVWYPGEDKVSPLEKELIEMSDHSQRFHDFGINTLVNCGPLSLLATNMPIDDPERYGRIKDLLVLLLSSLGGKLYALTTQEALQQQAEDLHHALGRIRGSLYQLGNTMLQNRNGSSQILQEMIHSLQDDLLRMGLEEDEEQYLIERIDRSAEIAVEHMDARSEIGQSFAFVHQHLKYLAKQQRKMTDTLTEMLEHQKRISREHNRDIEIF